MPYKHARFCFITVQLNSHLTSKRFAGGEGVGFGNNKFADMLEGGHAKGVQRINQLIQLAIQLIPILVSPWPVQANLAAS